MLQMCRRSLLMAAMVGAQGVCAQRMLCWPSQAAVSPVQCIMYAPADGKQCKTGVKDMPSHHKWERHFTTPELASSLSAR